MEGKKKWFALYTRPRFEKKAFDDLVKNGFEAYLPLYKTLRVWSDRKKMVEAPLFSSYCFVRIDPKFYLEPLKAYGVVKYVWFDGKPVPVPEKEIDSVKILCGSMLPLEYASLDLEPGQKIRINHGVLKGLEGEYIEKAGKNKILVRVNSISHALMVTIDPAYLSGQ
ncbi:MAG: hypothetical protein A2W91_07090 [Bacteroidetes bacterium GWF2_38_335]|nr:MAG: hypothetical protein A2W91_07090 [Bacteroidetes bacterium GWF2_38_335]OFY77093.1 MAG: hypothetical protein A2281_14325 [Bacteroidetes bacterium RIFOXYA12_FULL_38_20]HBS84983.1 antitermination protein NusG [Bacteroidales bacterium]